MEYYKRKQQKIDKICLIRYKENDNDKFLKLKLSD